VKGGVLIWYTRLWFERIYPHFRFRQTSLSKESATRKPTGIRHGLTSRQACKSAVATPQLGQGRVSGLAKVQWAFSPTVVRSKQHEQTIKKARENTDSFHGTP